MSLDFFAVEERETTVNLKLFELFTKVEKKSENWCRVGGKWHRYENL